MIHALITFVICGTMLLFHLPWIALFWPSFFYLGREIARYIEVHGGKKANYPSWWGFIALSARKLPFFSNGRGLPPPYFNLFAK